MVNIDYKEILEKIGYQLTDRGEFWQTSALFRNGDNKTAIAIYKDSGVWKDFVEDTPYLPFIALVEKTIGSSDKLLLKKITEGKSETYIATPQRKLLNEEKSYKKESLSKLLPHYDTYINPPKNISLETLKDYQCGLATSGKMYQRIVFPIFRQDGRIHGFSGRLAIEKENSPKWLHIGKTRNWFYPFFTTPKTAEKIEKEKTVVLVESIGDSIALYDAGIENNLVIFGLSASPAFISKLGNLNLDKIIISLNNDFKSDINRGLIRSAFFATELCRCIDFEKIYFSPPTKNDFGDMTKEEIRNWFLFTEKLKHEDSSKNVIEVIKKQERLTKQQQTNLKLFSKKFKFNYE